MSQLDPGPGLPRNGRARPGPCRPLDDSATFPSNDDSSDDDDDDEDEEEYPMEESLVNLVGNTIKELAPAAQVFCRKQIILEKLGRMGIFRVEDLQTMVDGGIQMASPEMVVCCISPHATCPPRRLVSPARTLSCLGWPNASSWACIRGKFAFS